MGGRLVGPFPTIRTDDPPDRFACRRDERSQRICQSGRLFPTGSMAFRTLVPTGRAVWKFKPAADGQMGCIMKLYREWKLSGDDAFLQSLWPQARKAKG